jgi:ribose 5-phosphate isomerase A
MVLAHRSDVIVLASGIESQVSSRCVVLGEPAGGRAAMTASLDRMAAVRAAVERVEPGMTIGLGSGRAVFALCDALGSRWGDSPPIRAAVASGRTRARAIAAGLPLVELDGTVLLDLALDGADEITNDLRLIKGGGAALLREKLVVAAARRFVVVAEISKLVDRLGANFPLPVEVVRFAWGDTRRRLLDLVGGAELRRTPEGQPLITEEGHYLLDCSIPAGADPADLAEALDHTVGVVEHGFFLDQADEAVLGRPDGSVTVLTRS